MNDLPGSIMQSDASGCIVFANKACHTILGFRPGTLEGRFQWTLASDPEEAEHVKAWFRYMMHCQPCPEPFLAKFKTRRGKTIILQVNWNYKCDDLGRTNGVIWDMTDISKTKQDEYHLIHALIRLNEKLIKQEKVLEETKTVIKVLIKEVNESKEHVEKKVQSSVTTLIYPYIEQLKNCRLKEERKNLLRILEFNLREITRPFVTNMTATDAGFTPMEIQTADLVRQGKTNKEIAQILSISSRTVGFHRENLRKKLGIRNKKANLRSVLLSRFK